MDGVIREVSFANSVSGEGEDDWVGRPWIDTVGDAGGGEIRRMMAEARANGVSNFRQLSQRFPSGLELPMEYNAVRVDGRSRSAKSGLIVVGKTLLAVAGVQSEVIEAQQAREQDAWRLRAVETRGRGLLDASEEPVLLLRMDDLHILDANAAAIQAGAFDAGRDFALALAPRDREAFQTMMARVGEQGRAPGILLHFGSAPAPWLLRASVTTGEPQGVFLLQLSPVAPPHPVRRDITTLEELIERLPDGFVLIDATGFVVQANRAFLDLVQAAAPGAVIGQPVARWLTRPGADAAVLIAAVHRHRLVRGFATSIQGELGTEANIEISGAGDPDAGPRHIVLLLRDVSRRPVEGASSAALTADERLLRALTKLTDQIGRVPLLDLVRDTGGLIERHCIEGALDRAHGNRTVAAGMLGLSRQSLYAKLGRYGMAGHGEEMATGG